jgi:putative FmdB family regulatory protein
MSEFDPHTSPQQIFEIKGAYMPIHEYRCEKCGNTFEDITMKIKEVKESIECPKCKSIAKKIISSGTLFTIHGYNSSNGYAGHMR